MRFVLVLLICHQVGHDSNLASAVINAGTSLQRAIFSSQGCCWELAIAKNALEGFHKRYCLWWNLRTSCLSSGQLIVLTHIPCDLSSLTPALRCLWQACYQCLMGESEWGGEVTAAASLLTAWEALRWQRGLCPLPRSDFSFTTPSPEGHLVAAIFPRKYLFCGWGLLLDPLSGILNIFLT